MRRRRNVLGAFAPSDFPKSVTQVNKHLREQGIPVTAHSGGGYFYFTDAAGHPVDDASIFTPRASDQSFSEWERDARDAATKAAEAAGAVPDTIETTAHGGRTVIRLRRRLDGVGAFTSNADLDKFKYRITKKQDGHVLRVYDGKTLIGAVGAITRGCDLPGYESHGDVVSAEIIEGYRGRKLYQEMLLRLNDHLKKMGCKGLKSHGYQRSRMADRAWRKLNPRVVPDKHRPTEPGYDVLHLDGLPKKGRIPVATVKRALARLGRKAKACRITPAALREGMEVEREHRDVTRGGVLKTARIAAAHLCERPDYYKRLKRFVE